MKFLVTGAAGFIGLHVIKRLLSSGYEVVGIDNLNDYYDINLKRARLELIKEPNFTFHKMDLINRQDMEQLFYTERFHRVIHFAAHTGVRYSLENPYAYVNTNLVGYLNVLELCRHNKVQHLLYASSSSVYGLHCKTPYSSNNSIEYPISVYAATKKANELMSHAYSHLYSLPTTGLRFFTVYGPWGRPDMALFRFTKAILLGKQINIYNYGRMKRDFTYIDDITEAVMRLQSILPKSNAHFLIEKNTVSIPTSSAPYCIYDIGNGTPIKLTDCISILEETIGRKAKKCMLPMQPGDVLETFADTKPLCKVINFKPDTPIKDGIKKFVKWYKEFYNF